MFVIDNSQLNGVTIDWKFTEVDGYEKSEQFYLPEPFQSIQIHIYNAAYSFGICGKQLLPDELHLTMSLINDDSNTSVDLNLTERNGISRTTVEYFTSADYLTDVKQWTSKDGLVHLRVVITDQSVLDFKDHVIGNHELAFSSELATNVKLLIAGQTIKANKYVLMAQSDVFQAMFERWDEKDGDEVEIKDVEYESMLAFVKALYTGTIKMVDVDFAFKVMTIADRYNVPAIKNACGEYVGKNMSSGNVLKCLVEADKLNAASMTQDCLKLMSQLNKDKLNGLKETGEWKQLNRNQWFSALYGLFSQFDVIPSYSV